VLRPAAAMAVAGVLVGALFASGPPAMAQKNSEQIVFSGTGSGDFGVFGFWVWCEADSGNPYQGRCSGSTYFYDLRITKHVTGQVSEPDEHEYQMVVSSKDGSVACTLTNVPPITKGPTNTVNASCSAPAGDGTSTNAVVRATGPG
jgi:hypothetical protein